MRMRNVVICGTPGSTIFLHTLSHTARFQNKAQKKKTLWDIKWVFWYFLQILSETIPILKRSEWDMTIYVYCSACNVQLFLSDFNATWIFSTVLRKILKYQIWGKSVQWKQRFSMWTDGRKDGRIVTFPNFANTPENVRGLEISIKMHPSCCCINIKKQINLHKAQRSVT